MKFYHVADVHLGAVPDRSTPWSDQRRRGIYESFYRLLDSAKRRKIDVVFICGDLFHRQPLKQELKELNYHFAQADPVLIFIIAGNHDYIAEHSSYVNYPWSSNVKFIISDQCQMVYLKHLNVCIYGFSYHRREIEEPIYNTLAPVGEDVLEQKLPKNCCHILMAHGGDEKHIPINLPRLESSGFDYVALGHIHKPWISSAGKAAYSGALEPVDKNDEGPHGFIEGETLSHGVHIRFVPFARWSYMNLPVDVRPEMSWEEIKAVISDKIAEGDSADGNRIIYKVKLSGYKDVNLIYNTDEIYQLGRIADVRDCMDYDFDFESLYEANKGNLLGRYIEKVWKMDGDDEMKKKILNYGFNALYRTGEQK